MFFSLKVMRHPITLETFYVEMSKGGSYHVVSIFSLKQKNMKNKPKHNVFHRPELGKLINKFCMVAIYVT